MTPPPWRCPWNGCRAVWEPPSDALDALIVFEKHYLTHMYPRKEAA